MADDPWAAFVDPSSQGSGAKDPWAAFVPSAAAAPKKPFGLMDTWPARLVTGLYESGKRVVTAPVEAASGAFAPPLMTPGTLTEEDVFRQDTGRQAEAFRGAEAAMLVTPMSPAARAGVGWAGVPKGLGRADSEEVARAAAANQQAADEFGIPLSRGQATGNLDAIRYEDMAARGAYGKPSQERAAPFFQNQFEGIQEAGRDIGRRFARENTVAENPGTAGQTINSEVGSVAAMARAEEQAAAAHAEREAAAQRGMLDDQGRVIGDVIREGRLPIENPREAGEIVGHEVRSSAARDRANYQRLYNEAFELPGQFHATAFEGVGNRIQGRLTLGDNPVIIDDVTTPVASRAIRDLDNISGLRIQNRADPFGQPNPENIVAVDLRGVDQARKRLVAFYRSARGSNNPADARATGRLIDEFDNQVEASMANGLFSGDPRALDAIRQARGAYSQYARAYRPQQAGDDVGTAMRRIIDRNATPEEIANMVVGSGRIGNAGLPVRIADRLEAVLGRDSDAWSTIRQAIWQKAAQARNPIEDISVLAGSSLGRRIFNQHELAAMRAHVTAARSLDQTIASLPATQAADQARASYQQVFSGEGVGAAQGAVFRRVIDGTATPEETAQAVFGAIGAGNPGNVSRLIGSIQRIVGANSDTMGAIRQGVWQKLTQNAAGKDQPGQQKLAQSIGEFLNGKGRTIAEQLYSRDELALMRRYADVVRQTIIPKYARTNSDTAPALMAVMHKLGGAIMAGLGAVADHGVTGGLAGYGVSKLLQRGVDSVTQRRAANKTARYLEEPVPALSAPASGALFLPPAIGGQYGSQQHKFGGRVGRR